MGWSGTYCGASWAERKRSIEDDCRPHPGGEPLAFSHSFGVSWVLWHSHNTNDTVPLCILNHYSGGMLMTKDLDVTCGPYKHNCPVGFVERTSLNIWTGYRWALMWLKRWVSVDPASKRRQAVLATALAACTPEFLAEVKADEEKGW